LGTATALIAAGPPLRSFAQEPVPLRIACTASDSYAEGLYGTDQGFFTRAGLTPDLQVLSSGAAITAAVASGAVDVGITNPIPLLLGVAHGIPFVYICSGGLNNNDESALCVAPDSTIRTGKDFAGKTIASSSLVDINTIAIKAWIDLSGGDSTKTKFVELPFGEMAAALGRGTVDAAPIVEPALSAAKKAGSIRVLQPALYVGYGANFMVGGWFCRADWLAQHRDAARRFVAAIYDTARWANANADASAAILAKYAKMDPQTLRTMSRAPYGTSLTPNMLQPVFDLAYKYRAVDKRYDAVDVIGKV
jgi:NitT/TauT family transport system substrate-binding protein